MKNYAKKAITFIMTLAILVGIIQPIYADKLEPASGDTALDYDMNSQSCYGSVVNAYLLPEENGDVTRVEAIVHYGESYVAVERYNSHHRLIESKRLPFELPLFGGFYSGTEYNFFVFGQKNKEEDNGKEVFRVVRYDKEWNRVDCAGVYGANTTTPFAFGSLDMAEYDGTLCVRTCHEMYKDEKDIAHQATMTFYVDIETMTAFDCDGEFISRSLGGASHSFDQFAEYVDGKLIFIDQNDYYPRAIQFSWTDDFDGSYLRFKYFDLMQIKNEHEGPVTGVTLGNFAVTRDHYLVSGSSVNQDDWGAREVRNAFVIAIPRNNLSPEAVKTTWYTDYANDGDKSVYVPYIVKTGDDEAYLIWEDSERTYDKSVTYIKETNNTLCWQIIDGAGNPKSGIYRSESGALSSCRPIISDGKIVWYAGGQLDRCEDRESYKYAMKFYEIDPENPSELNVDYVSYFSDVDTDDYYGKAVGWAIDAGVTSGTGKFSFSPDLTCTRAQAVTFLWRVAGSPEAEKRSSFTDVPEDAYYAKAVDWAVENGITAGTGGNFFSPNAVCTRAQIITFIWKAAGGSIVKADWMFDDVADDAYYNKAVAFGIKYDITAGISAAQFGPDEPCTRAQIVTFLWRYANPQE